MHRNFRTNATKPRQNRFETGTKFRQCRSDDNHGNRIQTTLKIRRCRNKDIGGNSIIVCTVSASVFRMERRLKSADVVKSTLAEMRRRCLLGDNGENQCRTTLHFRQCHVVDIGGNAIIKRTQSETDFRFKQRLKSANVV